MLTRCFAALLAILLSFTVRAQSWNIDSIGPDTRISLMTCEPGVKQYAVYGHSAIRVKSPSTHYDFVFNYGTFDFNTPNFLLQFIRGKLLYYLTVEPFYIFEQDYVEDSRAIIEQELNLSFTEKQQLFSLLIENAKPENRSYHYDFIRDNCSSRIRDILKKALGDKLQFVENKDGKSRETFRKLIDSYLKHDEWTDLGVDLLLGMPVDLKSRSWGSMFLPEYLMRSFNLAVITDDTTRALCKPPIIIRDFPRQNTKNHPLTSPQVLFWLAFCGYLIWLVRQKNARNISPVFPFIVLTITGIIGWALIFMWFGTDHATTKWNLNLLWAFPLNLPLSFFLFKKELPNWVRRYFHGYRVYLTVFLFMMALLPQQFHQAIIPLVLLQILQLSAMLPLPKLDNPAEDIS